MKILVIGCGSIGRRHIRLLKEMGVEPTGCDLDDAAREWVEQNLHVGCNKHPESCFASERYDGAIIATPNHLHLEPAMECIRAGLSVLVEKPIAHTLEDAQAIAEAPRAYGEDWRSSVLVGYNMRYHPGLRRVKELLDQGTIGTTRHADIWCTSYLPLWRPGTDYRQNYAAFKAQGGGVLLDCSHEIDYSLWLFGEPEMVTCVTANTGVLGIDAEELADLTIRFKSGIQAHIHLSYLDRRPHRGCRIVCDKGTTTWDFSTDFVWLSDCPAQANPVMPDDMYRAELQHFLACIHGEETPLVTGEDGIRALRLVEAAKRSSAEGRVIEL